MVRLNRASAVDRAACRDVPRTIRIDRKLTLDWVQQRDGSRALVFDTGIWAAFQHAADAQEKNAPHVISTAVAECFGTIMMDNYTLNRFLPKANDAAPPPTENRPPVCLRVVPNQSRVRTPT